MISEFRRSTVDESSFETLTGNIPAQARQNSAAVGLHDQSACSIVHLPKEVRSVGCGGRPFAVKA